ncbi:MAG: hypothetical protein K2X47_18035, partial [Bdellovibrionales bacterium]|nr:hypothetical protein [Bdellovibrionales bacterium]
MKIQKIPQTLMVSVTLFVFLAACGRITSTDVVTQPKTSGGRTEPGSPGSEESSDPWAPRPPEEIHEQEKANKVCYPGNGTTPVCLNLIQPVDAEFRANYRYEDPRTAPDFPSGFKPDHYSAPTKFLRLTDFAANLPLAKNFGMQEFMSGV